MNRGLGIFFFSLAVSAGASLPSSVSIESQINTRNITSFTIGNGQNLTNFYESQRRFLKTIASDQTIYMKYIFFKKHKEHKELTDDLKLNNATNCMEFFHSKTKYSIIITLEENDKCLVNQESILIDSLNLKVRGNDVQSAFSSCFKEAEVLTNNLHCMDRYMLTNVKDERIKKVYNNTMEFLRNLENTMVTSFYKCSKKLGNVLNPTILYVVNEFHDCVEKQAETQIATDDEKKLSHEFVKKRIEFSTNITNLYRIHTQMLRIIELEHQHSIKILKDNLVNHYREIIKSVDIEKQNVTCCSRYPNILIDVTSKNALNQTDECFRHHWSNFNNFINSTIQNVESTTSFQVCHTGNSSHLTILECYDRTMLRRQQSEKNIYIKAESSVKEYTEKILLEKYKCLEKSMKIFSESLEYSTLIFNSCLNDQTFSHKCIESNLEENDCKKLLGLNVISLDFYKFILRKFYPPRVG